MIEFNCLTDDYMGSGTGTNVVGYDVCLCISFTLGLKVCFTQLVVLCLCCAFEHHNDERRTTTTNTKRCGCGDWFGLFRWWWRIGQQNIKIARDRTAYKTGDRIDVCAQPGLRTCFSNAFFFSLRWNAVARTAHRSHVVDDRRHRPRWLVSMLDRLKRYVMYVSRSHRFGLLAIIHVCDALLI